MELRWNLSLTLEAPSYEISSFIHRNVADRNPAGSVVLDVTCKLSLCDCSALIKNYQIYFERLNNTNNTRPNYYLFNFC